MNQEQLEQFTANLKQTLNKLSKEQRDTEIDMEKIGIIFYRTLAACDDNAALAVKLLIYALKSNMMDKYGKDHPIWYDKDLIKVEKLCKSLENYVKTTI